MLFKLDTISTEVSVHFLKNFFNLTFIMRRCLSFKLEILYLFFLNQFISNHIFSSREQFSDRCFAAKEIVDLNLKTKRNPSLS